MDTERLYNPGTNIQWHMDAWDAGKHAMLVQATEHDMGYFLTTHQHGTTSAQWHQTFHHKVLCGKVCAAVWYLMAMEKGGVLFPEDVDPLTGLPVVEVLASKHPPPQTPFSHLPPYISLYAPLISLIWTSLQILLNVLPIGSMVLQVWGVWGVPMLMLSPTGSLALVTPERFLCAIVTCFACWLANDFPPWAAY